MRKVFLGLLMFFAARIGAGSLGSVAEILMTTAHKRTPPPPARVVPPPKPPPDMTRYLPSPGELRQFARVEASRTYKLSYGFVDYVGHHHLVSCGIDKADVETEQTAYGYVSEEMRIALNARLQTLMEAEAVRRGVREHIRITMEGWGGYTWKMSWDTEATRQELEDLKGWLDAEIPTRREAILQELYRAHGFLVRGDRVRIDYNAIARRATPHVGDCFQALLRSAEGYPTKQVVGLLLAFYQELKYEVPPDQVGAKRTMGLWVPAEVLASGKGDCDSKAVAFAAMWRRLEPRVIVILVPHHALIGVEAKPGPDESYVRVGNRYFVLCEVAGPAKLRPGYHSLKGSFEYVLIDPA